MASEQSEPKRCECYRCSGRGWKTVLVDAGPAQKVTCKLCGGDGEIEAPECRCGWCHWSGVFWLARGGTPVSHCPGECGCRVSVVDGEPRVGEPYADLERDARRFRAVAGAVGPMQNRLLAGYRRAVEDLHNSWPQDECPMDFNHDCQFPADACCDSDGDCQRAARHEGRCCWLGKWGLADTYAEAAVLWARMEEAAK